MPVAVSVFISLMCSRQPGLLFASANSSGLGSVSSGLEAGPSSALPERENLGSQALVGAIVLGTSFLHYLHTDVLHVTEK